MFDDGFGIMLSKFSDDARREIRRRRRRERLVRQHRVIAERAQEWFKRVLLGLALIGAGVGVYYGHALGKMLGDVHYSSSAETDPSLRGMPEPNAKQLRRMKELAKQHEDDLNEVDKILDGTQ